MSVHLHSDISYGMCVHANILDMSKTDELVYFEDLMDESSLSSSMTILEKNYDDAIRNKGDLDERIFINDDDSLLGSGSLSGGAINMNGAKVCPKFKKIPDSLILAYSALSLSLSFSFFFSLICTGRLI